MTTATPPPPAAMDAPLHALPLDAWMVIQRGLDQRDLANLAQCSSDLRATVRSVVAERGARVSHQRCREVADAHPDLTALTVRGLPARFGRTVRHAMGELSLPPMARLRSLTLHQPRLPDAPFWPLVFARCPALQHVRLVNDFYMSTYARDVRHGIDLFQHGAPRLRHLDVEGGWLVLYRIVNDVAFADAASAIEAAHALPPVASSTLTRLRTACKPLPVVVDAPVTRLDIEEPHERPFVAARMGPLTCASVRDLVWKSCWPAVDATPLGRFVNLRTADVNFMSITTAARAARCLDTLRALPASLRRLTVRLDLWMMRTLDSNVQWGRPLAHLAHLEHIELVMLYPPTSAETLVSEWLGAGGPAMRTAVARFSEPATRCVEEELDRIREREDPVDSDDEHYGQLSALLHQVSAPVYGCGLSEWLDDTAPAAVATVYNFDTLICEHRRCVLL
jgi:hypothetical protein